MSFSFWWRMCVHLLKGRNRAVVPSSSIRRSQQPFLVLDGAVTMHRLISPHWELRDLHSSFKKTERRDLRGVSIHKDRWISARKGTLNIQNVTVQVSGPGRGVSTRRAVPCLSRAASTQKTGARLVLSVAFFLLQQRRTEVGIKSWEQCLKKQWQ